MTIREVARSLYEISVQGRFNGEKVSRSWLERYISNMFRDGVSLTLKNRLVMEIALPDGTWYFQVVRYNDRTDGFDYVIPDDRDQERRLLEEFLG